jgi:CheY-like chemotaxis protein
LLPDALIFDWAESGGPQIARPTTRSFGLRVIRASIEQQLSGTTKFNWDPGGLHCTFWIPRRATVKPREVSGAYNVAELRAPVSAPKMTGGSRVLVVEDEALVAMMIQECLAEFGYQVVGPISTTTEAAAKARDGQFEAAVLDINLGDGAVYPIADMLAARGVPFVFVTGYEADSVDSRFREIPILQKPIEREMLRKIFAVTAKVSATA